MCNATEENHQATADTAADKPIEGHAPWCDPALHATVAQQLRQDVGCCGRPIYTTVGDRDIGGAWNQRPGQEPTFGAEWDGRFPDLEPGMVLSLYKLFLSMSWEDVTNVVTMLGDAIDAYEGGDAWRDSFDGWSASLDG